MEGDEAGSAAAAAEAETGRELREEEEEEEGGAGRQINSSRGNGAAGGERAQSGSGKKRRGGESTGGHSERSVVLGGVRDGSRGRPAENRRIDERQPITSRLGPRQNHDTTQQYRNQSRTQPTHYPVFINYPDGPARDVQRPFGGRRHVDLSVDGVRVCQLR